jgi:hypothetical protein
MAGRMKLSNAIRPPAGLTEKFCLSHSALQSRRGSLYRSTGQNINGPNINELQINCSLGQQKPVDV